MEIAPTLQRLAIAAGLGLLVGLQRQHTKARLGGLRTIALVTVFGTLCGLLGREFGGWLVFAGFAGIAALLVTANVVSAERDGAGVTSEVAMLTMFGVGAYLAFGQTAVAVAVGGGVAALLEFKGQMHGLVRRLSDAEVTAIMRFALLALVILPVLPDVAFGPYAVLNAREIWFMVVLIVGINLAGYLVYKFLGGGAGVVLGGVLGGLISSTATTVSYAKRAAGAPEAVRAATLVILIASTVVFGRVLVEIAATAPDFFDVAWAPIGILLALMALLSLGVWFVQRGEPAEMPEQSNPTELKAALLFGGLYAVVLLAVAAAKIYLGDRGLYAVAALSGLTDVDAITLSASQLAHDGRIEASQGWRVVVVAVLSNLAFKAATVASLAGRRLFLRVAGLFGTVAAAGVLLLLFWPR